MPINKIFIFLGVTRGGIGSHTACMPKLLTPEFLQKHKKGRGTEASQELPETQFRACILSSLLLILNARPAVWSVRHRVLSGKLSVWWGGVDQITAKQLLLVPGEGLEKIVGPTGGLQPVANVLPAGLRAVETLTGQQFDKAVSFCGLAFF